MTVPSCPVLPSVENRPVHAPRAFLAPLSADTLLVSLATLVALGLGLFRNDHRSLWLDEAFSVGVFRDASWSEFWTLATRSEANMVLYHLCLHLWPLSPTEGHLRALSAVFSAAAIPVYYLLAKRLFDRPTALIAAGLLAGQPFLVEFSQEARGYTLAMLVGVLSVLGLLRAMESPTAGRLVWWGVITALGFYAHFFFGYVFALQLIYLLIKRAPASVWLVAAASALAASPLLLFISHHPGEATYAFMQPADLSWVRSTYVVLVANDPLVALLVASGGVLAMVGLRQSKPRRSMLAFVLAWAALPIVMVVVALALYPMTSVRYFLIALPALTLLAAYACVRVPWQPLGFVVAVVAISASAASAVARHDDMAPWKVDVRAATSYLASHIQQGDSVVVTSKADNEVYDYYRAHGRDGGPMGLPGRSSQAGLGNVWLLGRGVSAPTPGLTTVSSTAFAGGLTLEHRTATP